MDRVKVTLKEDEMPTKWYNILPDLPGSFAPPLHPGTKQPIGPDDLKAIFPMSLIGQEVSDQHYIDIPEEVREAYLRIGRPTPLYRATRLEKALGTPAKIYYKREDVSFVGSHKTNTAIPQAYYNMKEGVERLSTETGAGQWGCALSLATKMFGLKCLVYMVKVSFEQKPYRKYVMNMYGANVIPSPSMTTESGKKILADDPKSTGSLGIAISEAVEVAAKDPKTNYALGSVLNHVMLHQTVIGQEVQKQLQMFGAQPDIMIGCAGGGSNFAGFTFPLVGEKIKKKNNIDFIAVEPKSVPSMTGINSGMSKFDYDFGDTAELTPLLKMYTLGHKFKPDPIHAGGLRYHGMAPTVSHLLDQKVIRAEAYEQNETFDAAKLFSQTEGIIPAPESSHAIACAVKYARLCKQKNEAKTIVFNLSGHGLLDLGGYASVFKL
ncbi:Tryptophan synthase beta chain 2 [Candidatus Gugararchaeum adminiculabundum]|nr:Tryptophan synthase beta chain 2 [Candidatus Gugararchaeum adminiculabundum]